MSDWLNLEGKTIVVTGGASGIGDAIVHELIGHGANVVNADLKEGNYKDSHLTFVQTDITNAEDAKNVTAKALEITGKIDGLVNNAGINMPRLLVDTKNPGSKYELNLQTFEKMFNVNVFGLFQMTQPIVHEMAKQKSGVVVNMSSEAGLEGSQGQSPYSATKGAINALTRSWAKELGEYHIRVVGVAPGIMEATGLRTPAYEEALAYARHTTVDAIRKGYSSTTTTPLGRSGHLYEVADLVSYFLSERASYITGVTTNVAGGKSRG